MAKQTDNKPDAAPTLATIVVCLIFLAVLQGIAAATKTEIPLIVYAIVAGILFGIGNIKNIIGGNK